MANSRYEIRDAPAGDICIRHLGFDIHSLFPAPLFCLTRGKKTINVYGQDRIFALMYTATMPLQACLLDGIGLWLACHCNAKVCLSENWRSYKLLKI